MIEHHNKQQNNKTTLFSQTLAFSVRSFSWIHFHFTTSFKPLGQFFHFSQSFQTMKPTKKQLKEQLKREKLLDEIHQEFPELKSAQLPSHIKDIFERAITGKSGEISKDEKSILSSFLKERIKETNGLKDSQNVSVVGMRTNKTNGKDKNQVDAQCQNQNQNQNELEHDQGIPRINDEFDPEVFFNTEHHSFLNKDNKDNTKMNQKELDNQGQTCAKVLELEKQTNEIHGIMTGVIDGTLAAGVECARVREGSAMLLWGGRAFRRHCRAIRRRALLRKVMRYIGIALAVLCIIAIIAVALAACAAVLVLPLL
eukprot:TRINITY_DN709_c1_g1_i4.p1 TRINITY_DN709_c1_g1~~TRINITY_DN709_c1_g1_i4.p1  ORF type:complete len:312 (-),score=91.80 TRINITY_DN709_c1_g1_i4:29-964(-)